MTTPRDDITRLSERLRDPNAAYTKHTGGDPDQSRYIRWLIQAGKEAATAIDSLQARVKELEAGWHDCITELTAEKKRALVAEARALRAEQERDEAYEQAVDAMRKAIDPSMEGILREAADRAETAIRRLAAGAEKEGE